jgi:hypothetical protein
MSLNGLLISVPERLKGVGWCRKMKLKLYD